MMGQINYILGLQIKQMNQRIFINQRISLKIWIGKTKIVITPMSSTIKLNKNGDGISMDIKKYKGMIGSLLYLIASKPDMMFSIKPQRIPP